MNLNEDQVFAALAVALVQHPRSTYQELATNIGVSRATLFRFCSTRDELILRILRHATNRLNESLAQAHLEEGAVEDAVKRLINSYLINKELVGFISQYWDAQAESDPDLSTAWAMHQKQIDDFFLRGQQTGHFRVDVSAEALNEALCWLIVGLVDGERRGRVARTKLSSTIENLFLSGMLVRK
ncbi:TetR/AcrR family transcriptional regulator [Acinetobacter sp. GN11]